MRILGKVLALVLVVAGLSQAQDGSEYYLGGCAVCVSVRTNQIAAWHFEEASGTRVDEVVGNTYNLTATNTPGNAAGKINNALALVKASSQYADTGATTLPLTTTDWTFFGWLWIDTGGFNQVMWETTGATVAAVNISVGNAVRVNIAGVNVVASSAISTGAWHSVCARFTTSNKFTEISVDGAAFVTGTAAGAPVTGKLWFGQNGSGGSFLDGRIDESGFWTRLLTAAEVAYLVNGGSGRAIY